MKNLFKIILFCLCLVGVSACSSDDESMVESMVDVNYVSISGIWRMSEWNGEKMDEDSRYYYIVFNRKAENNERKYTIYTNLNSAYSQRIYGTYLLDYDDDYGDMITGTYDYTLSTDYDWDNDYSITEMYATSMKWQATKNKEELRTFTRCEEVPADILNGTRSIR